MITYRDGVATFPGYFTAEPYYDIARVEILRGPQGTFVGQNATGGAVFVTSNNPVIDGGYHGYIAGQIGNYSDFGAQGAMNLPINDELAARVAFNGEMRDSFYDITGPYTGDDGVQMAERPRRAPVATDEPALGAVQDRLQLPRLQRLSGRSGAQRPTTCSISRANADLYARDKFGRSSLKIDYAFDDGTTIRSITGYQWGNSGYRTDLDGTSVGHQHLPRLGRRGDLVARGQHHFAGRRAPALDFGRVFPDRPARLPAGRSS